MNLSFEKVNSDDFEKIIEIYNIIHDCGQTMLHNQGLTHWSKPYPIDFIKQDCLNRDVYLIKDLNKNTYVHTFQLEFRYICDDRQTTEAYLYKFATRPNFSGKGIGKFSMDFIEDYCRSIGVAKISLEVYEKSEHAIRFYQHRGFIITGQKQTRHFVVYLMEKTL